MKLQSLVVIAVLAVAVAEEYLQEERVDSTDDADWERFKVKNR